MPQALKCIPFPHCSSRFWMIMWCLWAVERGQLGWRQVRLTTVCKPQTGAVKEESRAWSNTGNRNCFLAKQNKSQWKNWLEIRTSSYKFWDQWTRNYCNKNGFCCCLTCSPVTQDTCPALAGQCSVGLVKECSSDCSDQSWTLQFQVS